MKKEGQKKRISLNRNIVIIVAIVLLICYVSKFPWVFSKKYKHHDLDHAEIKLSEEIVTYSGMEVAPEIQVIVDDEVLKEGEDYEVQYFQNVMPGTAFAMISGIGAYDGNSFASFRILINDEIRRTGKKEPEVMVQDMKWMLDVPAADALVAVILRSYGYALPTTEGEDPNPTRSRSS